MKRVSEFLLKGLLKLFGKLPLKVQYANANFLAWLVGHVIGYRRDDVMVNLSRSFPEKKYGELIKIKNDFYRHFADLVVETVWFGASDSERLRRQELVRISNPEVLNRLYEASPSIIVMFSHCGNWELLGGMENYCDSSCCINEGNCCVVYKQQHSEVWNDILRDNRKAPTKHPESFEGYLESGEVLRYIFSHKGEKKVYFFNTDQSPYQISTANMRVDFMHQPTLSMTAAAAIARKFGMAVAYMNMKPESRGHYVMEYTAICDNATEMPVESIINKFYELLEKDLNETPANYLWTHRRWKEKVN